MRGKIRLYPWELESMDEYSYSLPSAATLFKTWKRDRNGPKRFHHRKTKEELPEDWVVGRYVRDFIPNMVAILWMEVEKLQSKSQLRT